VIGSRYAIVAAFGLLALLGGTAIVLGVRFFHGPDRDRYVASNAHVVGQLPRPNGAHKTLRQILREEDTVFGEQLSHTVGYTTYIYYTVPNSLTSKDVVQLYARRLPGWQRATWLLNGTTFACFARDGATVSIQTDGMTLRGGATEKGYGIAVNHKGGNCN